MNNHEDFDRGTFVPPCVAEYYINQNENSLRFNTFSLSATEMIECAGMKDCEGSSSRRGSRGRITIGMDSGPDIIAQEFNAICLAPGRLRIDEEGFTVIERIRPHSINKQS